MAIVINGSGTVTGISVGGLPDGIVDSGTLATNSVDSAELIDGAIDNSHLADDAVAVAELSATGTASSSTFLRGDNAWAAAGGGKVLQVVADQNDGNWTTTDTNFDDTYLSVNITPASAANKILIMITCGISPGSAGAWGTIERTVGVTETNLGGSTEGFSGWGANSGTSIGNISYLDSPSTTSEVTYKFQVRSSTGGTVEASYASSAEQSIIVMEVEG